MTSNSPPLGSTTNDQRLPQSGVSSIPTNKLPLPNANEDFATGVSNGDVDWLFRGKSKKLGKKMANNNANKDERKNSHGNIKNSEKTTAKPNETKHESNGEKLESKETKSEKPTKHTTTENPKAPTNGQISNVTPSQPSPKQTTSGSTNANDIPPISPKQPEKASKLNKLKIGRSRSSSASTVVPSSTTASTTTNPGDPKSQPKRRSSSFNFVTPSLTSDLAYDDPALVSQLSNNSNSSNSSSPNVSRSNSKKGGLFSSLSSKFRSSSASSKQPQSHSSSTPSTTTTNGGGNSSAAPKSSHHSPKFNPSLVGPVSKHNREAEDLVSLTNTLPAGSGIPIKRKPSIPGNSIFKDSFLDDASSSPSSSLNSDGGLKFFRRRSSVASTPSTHASTPRVILNKNPNRRKVPIEEISEVRLRRVTFSVDKLEHDPQQQIPSRKPKRGNVLIPQDINAPPPRLCLGISVNEPNNKDDGKSHNHSKYSDHEIALAEDAQRRAIIEAEKHAQEAHRQAKKIAQEVSGYRSHRFISIKEGGSVGNSNTNGNDNDEDDDEVEEAVDKKLANDVSVDGPLHVHEQHFEEEIESKTGEKTISLETIYTRCCHLREILPIPATLKQLKNKTAPLEVLKMLNPKPTLIDVLSFSDFIAITPINTVIFDNVTMTTEMLKNFLGSLTYNKQLEKLSLRNVSIDELGWKYLCEFLATNKTVKKLDISQQRIKPDTPDTSIRGNMNWDLFIRSLILRGGIEELVINGCKLSDAIFEKFINQAVKKSTYRLGIAGIDLNVKKSEMVTSWLTDGNSQCVGVDIAFNDLSKGQLRPFINAFNTGKVNNLVFFSLNSTNLSNIEETSDLIKSLINVKTLRFLDLSSIPNIFPKIITHLDKYLPRYPNLRRIHFDLNELTAQAIGSLAGCLSKMPQLVHVSLLGNRNLSTTSAATLYGAVKQSKTLFALDLDYDLIPDQLSQRIAFYLMRNLEYTLKPSHGGNIESNPEKPEDLMYDGSLLMETAEKLLVEIEKGKKEDIKMQRIISDSVLERTRSIRKDIHKTIDTLFEQRNLGKLSFEGKENLVRFCLLDSSLEKLVAMVEEHANGLLLTPTTSTDDLRSRAMSPSVTVDTIHESANELITAGPILSPHVNRKAEQSSYFPVFVNNDNLTPHQVVVESNDEGRDVPIDKMTGRPVLIRSISQTSVHAKEQEIEEGELHKFGFFIQQKERQKQQQQQNSHHQHQSAQSIQQENQSPSPQQGKYEDLPILNTLPSGPELRDAIMAAKGVANVTELIDRINNHRVKIDAPSTKHHHELNKPNSDKVVEDEVEVSDNASIDSTNGDDLHQLGDGKHNGNGTVDPMVSEVYDKLLNDAERVRSNRDI
ncbi:hypothetical protein MGS_05147 [Candida albicans P78042]|nr:hypothetical protein MGS_05147 [Candida albicans P78042]